ncbi:S8 family serine peptidase [Ilumatobacter sp.]|uniref:S8 family serine peptidase n=1 Tax=Ilumatobacter sp. TaxID=1967498 RepID=UPI003AF46325
MSYRRNLDLLHPARRHLARRRRRAVAAIVAACSVTAVAGVAAAGKPDKGDDGGTSYSSCRDMLRNGATMPLDDVRAGIGADHALNMYGLTGGGVGVAVIDTGVNRVGGLNGNATVIDGPDLSFDALEENLRHRDLYGHGTNMAGIIAADNSASGDGVAPGSHVVNVKVGAGDGTVDVSQVIAAIDWVVQNRDINGHNIRVISLSYATDADQDYRLDPLSHAVQNAWNHGIVVVAAGGNDGRGMQRLGNPALNPSVIAVGNAQAGPRGGWKMPASSSTGDGVRNPDLVAPGTHIMSSAVPSSRLVDANPTAVCEDQRGELHLRGTGTSQAAAAVAGAAAVLLEQRPDLTPDQVKYLLTSTAVDIGYRAEVQGHGLVDLAAAVEAPTPGPEAVQTHDDTNGLGTLDGARGSYHVGTEGDLLQAEMTAFGGDWDAPTWAAASATGTAWTNQIYANGDNTWSGGTWSGATWSGASWSGASWSGATWSGASWSGATWSGASWSGASWSGASWSGASWSGASWSGASWSGASWS